MESVPHLKACEIHDNEHSQKSRLIIPTRPFHDCTVGCVDLSRVENTNGEDAHLPREIEPIQRADDVDQLVDRLRGDCR